ncbi:MAG: acetyl-CoA carboxylase biotin carboxyl carrier protein [Myxococcota bacterium]
MDIDTTQLEELMQLLAKHGFDEIEIERGEERVLLRRGGTPVAHASASPASYAPSSATSARGASASTEGQPAEADGPDVAYITSPFVGTFYRASSPDAPPYVEKDQEVQPGQVLCIVEAMKLMNEIEAEIGGTILDVLVENGTPVEYGDKLFKVRKKG